MSSELEAAVRYIANGPPTKGITNEVKLKFYGLYKAATVGPCNTPQPGRLNVVKRMKWNSWKSVGKNVSKDEAAKMYIELLETFAPNWREWKAAKL